MAVHIHANISVKRMHLTTGLLETKWRAISCPTLSYQV